MSLNYNVTPDALWVMTFAEMAATRNGRSLAKPVDLLLGLMLISDPVFSHEIPCLGGVLLRASCAAPDDLPTLHDMGWSELPEEPSFRGRLTPGITAVLDDATRLSRSLGADYIGSEHLLVSLVAESFDDDVDAWLTDAELTEAGVLRQWVALLLRGQSPIEPGAGKGA
jgi:ATP-dependent Clp protease ATP-binding subunit ClpA